MNSPQPQANSTRPTGSLSGVCYDALMQERSLRAASRLSRLGFLTYDVLDALDRAARNLPAIGAPMATLRLLLNQAASAALTDDECERLREAYEQASALAFPTCQAFLTWSRQFQGLSQEHSLASIDLTRLRRLEEASLADTDLSGLLLELRDAFGRIKDLDDSQGFRQAYEVYGEALVYSLLSARFLTRRIVAKSTSMPDFACKLKSGKEFFVELKSFDVVGGSNRSAELHEDAMQQQIDIEGQQARGELIAISAREVAPFKRAFAKPDEYDPRSILAVIETLINKSRSAFKASQFTQGPTFAFALCDRLLLPGGKHGVAPHYCESAVGAVTSGALWHACFGKAGWPISRVPDFAGSQGIEGYMSQDGLLEDQAISFPTGALIFAETTWQEDAILGLYDANWSPGWSWTPEDTEEVMHTLCTASNDRENSYGQLVAIA